MKRVWTLVISAVLFWLPSVLFAQGRVHIEQEGRPAGIVSSIELNGITYVEVQRTARKLGAQVELFATAKQAKITAKGFFAILTASLNETIVNGKHVTLPGEVVIRGGQLMAPVEVFLLPSFQLAVNRYIDFENNTLIVERRYNMELEDAVLNPTDNLLVFDTQKEVAYTTEQPNPHTVLVTFKDVTLKRDTYKRLRTDYIASAQVRQTRGDAELKVILGTKAKDWSFTPTEDGRLVFRAGATKAEPKLPAKAPGKKPGAVTPVLKAEPHPLSITAAPQDGAQISAPSVLTEDDFEEMVLDSMDETPVAATPVPQAENTSAPQQESVAAALATAAAMATTAAPANTTTTASTQPVIKAEPHPLAITAHKKMRIVVDPGHGGKDAGAVRGKYREKDWNLAVGNELARLLKKGNFEVKITRSTDVFIALSERSKIANNFKADLFVSVHVNATKNSKASGFQVYFRSEKATDREAAETAALENEAMQYEEVHYNFVDALLQSLAKNEYINESSKLAGYIKNSVYKQPGIGIPVDQKNAIRQANFYVLKGVQSPSVLVEMGFISSPKDRARLSQEAVQKKMAQGIYNGIVSYAKQEGWLK